MFFNIVDVLDVTTNTAVSEYLQFDCSQPKALQRDIEFLDAGEPPLYFGLGSMRAPNKHITRAMIESARAFGRRAIVSSGWADLALIDNATDCLSIGEVNQQLLFARVAAVVHHGGAGTTMAAAMAGAPQTVIPKMFDQHYWAKRVERLGTGSAHAPSAPTTESLIPIDQITEAFGKAPIRIGLKG